MAVKTFSKIPSGDRVLDQVQDSVASVLNGLSRNPSNNRSLLTNVSLAAGLNQVSHGLGRALRGWNAVRVRASATLWDSQDTGSAPDKFLYLNASAPVVVDLECF